MDTNNYLDVFLVVSNLAFIVPMLEASRPHQNKWTMVIIYALTATFSSFYHTCNSFHGVCFGLSPSLWRHLDFFTAQLLIPVTALNLVKFPRRLFMLRRLLIVACALLIFFLLQYFEEGLVIQLALSASSLLFILLYWICYSAIRWAVYVPVPHGPRGSDERYYSDRRLQDEVLVRQQRLLPDYDWYYLTAAIGLTALSVCFFVIESQSAPLKWAIHSLWHVNAAFAQFFLLLIWKRRPFERVSERYIALDKRQEAGAHQQQARGGRGMLVHRSTSAKQPSWRDATPMLNTL